MSLMDKIHEKTCGSYSVVFRMAQPFLSECPCCSFYRGVGVGIALMGLVTWLV